MDSQNNVPYQTYRSKKHLRSLSSTPITSAAVTPDTHAHVAPPTVSESVPPQRLEPFTPHNPSELRGPVFASNIHPTISTLEVKSKEVPSVSSVAQEDQVTTTLNLSTKNQCNGKEIIPQTFPVNLTHEECDDKKNDTHNVSVIPISTPSTPAAPPNSTFRRMPSRARTASSGNPPSLRVSSLIANSPSFRRVSNNSRLRVSSESSLVFPDLHHMSSKSSINPPTPVVPDVLQPTPISVVSAPSNSLLTHSLPHTDIPSPPISDLNHHSRPSSSSSTFPPVVSRRPTSTLPYRPGFQPKGIYRQRTDEFVKTRSSIRDKDKVEMRRLERRLEKLIQLHFPQEVTSEKLMPPSNRRSMSFLDIDLNKKPSEFLKSVVESRLQGSKANVRVEEQYIAPWQPDSEVSQCPHCSASFHPLTNRKHHCRLCGRVVCSLPVKHPIRKQSCSTLFVVDQKTRMIEEVGEGVDYGVRRRTPSSGTNSLKSGSEKDDERFLEGVRICKTCRIVLLRQQYLQEAAHIPTFVKLHDVRNLNLNNKRHRNQRRGSDPSSNTPHQASAASLRKYLLESFATYDRYSKRISLLPVPKGSSQERVQNAVLSRATLFLQNNMFPLQSLAKFQPSPSVTKPSTPDTQAVALEEDKHLAETLQPLLEQEALLESFIEEAKAQRKFEDAKTLKANLEEIRTEIKRMALQAGAS
ncbi:hypothetical protein Clacol_006356 [Clathrus columnatus]|uniref:FYVE-type domain-containing protein n=1 Tax=Clathrus columnatus TaxID=1419009 RepID=A0AAV5AJI7_9AGAM|nr:hypothetical protein Clacol_006356 [Clathrus columnatus]